MRLHLYELKDTDVGVAFDKAVLAVVPAFFQLVGWALAMALLRYLGEKTGDPLVGSLFVVSSVFVFVYIQTLARSKFDFAIWRDSPTKATWKLFVEAGIYVIGGTATTLSLVFFANRLAVAASEAGIF